MKVLIVSEQEVKELLSMEECIDQMEIVLKTLSDGNAVNPLRSALRFPDGNGLLGMMPAYLGSPKSTGIKVIAVMPGNHGTPYDSHQGVVMLFELEHGCPLAFVEASSITAIRTAAASGVATKLLAKSGGTKLALLGSGVQASAHLDAMLAAQAFSEFSVWSRSAPNAQAFAKRESERLGVTITVAATGAEAVKGANVICTTTSSSEPILKGEWISPGTHINAVGACFPAHRELDSQAVAKSRLFVDWRESTFNESGDFRIPKEEGLIDDAHILGELGEILLGKISGRSSDQEITLFKSLGVGVEDLGAVNYVYEKAMKSGVGTHVEFGGPVV